MKVRTGGRRVRGKRMMGEMQRVEGGEIIDFGREG